LSMLLRSIYGGMKGDILFLKSSAKIWKERIEYDRFIWVNFLEHIWNNYPADLDFEIILLLDCDKHSFSVDQHCFGNRFCEKIIKDKNISLNNCKHAIWYWRSSIINKKLISSYKDYKNLQIDTEDEKRLVGMRNTEIFWQQISNKVEGLSPYYWR